MFVRASALRAFAFVLIVPLGVLLAAREGNLFAQQGDAGPEQGDAAAERGGVLHRGPALPHLEQAFKAAAARIAPAVVTIDVERDPTSVTAVADLPAYAQRPPGAVSGVAIGGGRVLTSAWNVEGAKAIRVSVPEGRTLAARVLGRDETLDLALLALADLPGGTLRGGAPEGEAGEGGGGGEPAGAVVGEEEGRRPPAVGSWLIAVGRGPAGTAVVNAGIVSALGRFRGDALQTDVALNYGNYGGAAVDIEGRLVGIPVRLSARAGVNSGVGFVIPLGRVREVLPSLERGEVRRPAPQAFLGVQFGREFPDPPGVEVARVVEGTAAAEGGLEAGDILRLVGDAPAVDSTAVAEAIHAHRPGDRLRLEVERERRRLGLEVTLGARPVER